jgi:hypothetical protein
MDALFFASAMVVGMWAAKRFPLPVASTTD